MESIYVIGDVHGCYETLMALISRFPRKEQSKICFVGDLVDRGPKSAQVVELVHSHGYDAVLGNHERKFILAQNAVLHWLERGKILDYGDLDALAWLEKSGGDETVRSYIHFGGAGLCAQHLKFLHDLPLYREYEILGASDRALVVSHSAVGRMWSARDNKSLHARFSAHVLSGRDDFMPNDGIFNVYGHTPQSEPLVSEYFANVDLGCVFKKRGYAMARLCALEFPSMRIFTQECIDFN